MTNVAIEQAQAIFQAATPIIRIFGVGGRRWKRNVEKGARIGPWLQGDYEILNDAAWRNVDACLYMVRGSDSGIRYVGISRNGLKHRWRTSPAYDAETMVRLPKNQIFHSQCWKHIEIESSTSPEMCYEVRCISGESLCALLEKLGPPLSGFCALRGDWEGIAAGVERWLCNHSSARLVCWNVAMSAGAKRHTYPEALSRNTSQVIDW